MSMRTSFRQEMRLFSNNQRIAWGAILCILLLYLPFILLDRSFLGLRLTDDMLLGIGLPQINFALIAIIGAISLNLLVGYAGLISLGHSAFFIVGAMTAGILDTQLHLPFVVVLAASGVIGAAVGAFVGLPSLRLSGLYLMLATLALHFIALYVFLKYQLAFFGPAGVFYPAPNIFGWAISSDLRWYFFLLPLAVIAAVCTRNLLVMREGRALVAIRENAFAAGSVGINVNATKLKAFALSSFMVSIAGTLYAYQVSNATVENYPLDLVITYFAMVIVGGLGSFAGAILGALFWQLFPTVLQTIASKIDPATPIVGELLNRYQGQTLSIILGTSIIFILAYKPAGLNGIWIAIRNRFACWPYSV